MTEIEVRIPDIGDFHDVPVLEVLVRPGDVVSAEDPLVALESEKATMEIPSPHAGVVRAIAVRAGDKVSEGSAILTLEAIPPAGALAEPAAVPASAPHSNGASVRAELIELRVPDLGDFADVPVIDVLVAAGDRVELESPLVTLESEKASIDVPSTGAGTIRDVSVKVGDRVSMGTLVATLETAAGAPSPAASTPATPPEPTAPPTPGSAPTPSVSTTATASEMLPAASNGVVHASPSVRRFARELGVNLHTVSGTGPHARITRDDVHGFVKRALAAPAATAPAAAPGTGLGFDLPPWPAVDFARYGEIETIPLARIRKRSGANLHRNWLSIPHVTNNDEADITELEALRKALNAENPRAQSDDARVHHEGGRGGARRASRRQQFPRRRCPRPQKVL